MKFHSLVVRFLRYLFGVKDDDESGKEEARVLFWALLISFFIWKFMLYKISIKGLRFFEEPGLSGLLSLILNFIAEHTGVEFIKNLNITKYIENFDSFWSMPIIVLVCFIINRHALSLYSRNKSEGKRKIVHYGAFVAHMFFIYISLLKFQWWGLLYFVVIFLTSYMWYLYYKYCKKQLKNIYYKNIFIECNVKYCRDIVVTSISLVPVIVIWVIYCTLLKLWGPPPGKSQLTISWRSLHQ